MHDTGWQWAVGVATAPRPEPTLERTLGSLQAAGFAAPLVVADTEQAGCWPTWLRALEQLVATRPGADAYLMVQDDAVFWREMRSYLERWLWPAGDAGICSPYCPTPYGEGARWLALRHSRGDAWDTWKPAARAGWGWQRIDAGWCLVGALCWAMHPTFARSLLRDQDALGQLGPPERRNRSVDARVGHWAQHRGRSVWYHTPSLAQHVGLGNSALGDPRVNDLRRAADFVGE